MLGGTPCCGVSGLPPGATPAKGVSGMLGKATLLGETGKADLEDRERAKVWAAALSAPLPRVGWAGAWARAIVLGMP